ncbi:hypothetical protein F4W70_05860 [Pseudomonas cannabina]|nr:hypothetical protein F4W70_05860 [Pseudomonas cannabina]
MFEKALFQATDLQRMYAVPVGANLFAKALFRTIHLKRMHRPLREQVRSHRTASCQTISGKRRPKAPCRTAHLQRMHRPLRSHKIAFQASKAVSDHLPLTTICAGASPRACQFGRYIDSTCGGGTR